MEHYTMFIDLEEVPSEIEVSLLQGQVKRWAKNFALGLHKCTVHPNRGSTGRMNVMDRPFCFGRWKECQTAWFCTYRCIHGLSCTEKYLSSTQTVIDE